MSRRVIPGIYRACPLIGALCCGPTAPESTGGVSIHEVFGKEGRSCGRGLAVSLSDESYRSTNIALLDLAGHTLSGSFISSGSTETLLNAPLSGDVVFPSARMRDELVLIDRYPNSVLTFVNIVEASVRSQLSVRTGFDSNPQDFVQLDDERAIISRYEKNGSPGDEPFDEGDDLLWIDPQSVAITGRIDLHELQTHPDERLRPSNMVMMDELLVVSLTGYDSSFSDAAWARLVFFDPESDEVVFVHEIEGMKNCGGLAVSPGETQIALSCSGLVRSSNQKDPADSGLVVLSADSTRGPMRETLRIEAADLGLGPFGFSIDYANENLLIVGVFGALEGADAGRADRLLSVDSGSGDVELLLKSTSEAFSLGGIRCMEACAVCFVADFGRDMVHRFTVSDAAFDTPTTHRVDTSIPLSPRYLGWF